MIKICIPIILFIHFGVAPVTSSTIEGKVTSDDTNKTIFSCTVTLYRAKAKVAATSTDINGNYFFSSIQTGTYDLLFTNHGYTTQKQINIPIKPSRTYRIDIKLALLGILNEVQIIEYKAVMIESSSICYGSVFYEKSPLIPSKLLKDIKLQSVKRLPGKRY